MPDGIQKVESVAGHQTHVQVKYGKTKIVFDLGTCPREAVFIDHVFITHGHMDHVACLFKHARLRNLMARARGPATYYIHEHYREAMEVTRKGFDLFEGGSCPMNIVYMSPGRSQNVSIADNTQVFCFATDHRVPSLGFKVYHDDRYVLMVSGDTTMKPLLEPCHLGAEQALMELTFIEETHREIADRTKHTHLLDFLENKETLLKYDTDYYFYHISARYDSPNKYAIIMNTLRNRRFHCNYI